MRALVVFLLCTFVLVCKTSPSRSIFTNHWAVRLSGGSDEADILASKYGFTNLGQVRFNQMYFQSYFAEKNTVKNTSYH